MKEFIEDYEIRCKAIELALGRVEAMNKHLKGGSKWISEWSTLLNEAKEIESFLRTGKRK